MRVNDEDDLERLLRFYIACIEAEDRRSLRRPLGGLHRGLLSPWDEGEPFFWPDAAAVEVEVGDERDRRVLDGSGAGPVPMVYGYPAWLDDEGYLTPLFLADVEVSRVGPGRYLVQRLSPDEVLVNLAPFRARGVQAEEMTLLQDRLEGEFGSFGDRLRAAFEALGERPPKLSARPLAPYPDDEAPRGTWVNRPLLFVSERSVFNLQLLRELDLMARLQDLHGDFHFSAAGEIVRMAAGLDWRPESDGRPVPAGRGAPTEAVPLLPVVPLNAGQRAAVEAALHQRVTVVTGPPGTGKSQVVVALLASFAAAGRPVLFASKNNKAVDVVRERLRAILGEDWDWVLRFGSRERVSETRAEMARRLQRLRGASPPPRPDPRTVHRVDEEIREVEARLARLAALQEELQRCEAARREAGAALGPGVLAAWDEALREGWDADFDVDGFVRCAGALAERAARLAGRRPRGFWLSLQLLLWPGRLRRGLAAALREAVAPLPPGVAASLGLDQVDAAGTGELADLADRLTVVGRWCRDGRRADEVRGRLAAEPATAELVSRLRDLQVRRADLAAAELRAVWSARLKPEAAAARNDLDAYLDLVREVRESRPPERRRNLRLRLHDLLGRVTRRFPVWIVTNLSVRNVLPLDGSLFDLVIIDEASQCDVPSALPLALRARRLLVIGDPHQLRHVSTLREQEEVELAERHDVGHLLAEASYVNRSFYDVAERAKLELGGEPLLLAEHYRSHPAIVEFPNQRFYSGRLVLRTDTAALRRRLGDEPPGVFWHDVAGAVRKTGQSAVNLTEVKAVVALLDHWAGTGFLLRDDVDFGVVTPFRLQMERLLEEMRRRPWYEDVLPRLTVGTAHRFQGDERDVVVFSPVVAKGLPPRSVRWVADTEQLLNVAITRARAALHVVGDLAACQAAGGCLGAFADAAKALSAEGGAAEEAAAAARQRVYASPAEQVVAELLADLGLWFAPQYPAGKYRLDFLVVTPYGGRYDVEVDGRQHRTAEQLRADEARDLAVRSHGLRVLRLDARDVFEREDAVREVLARLV